MALPRSATITLGIGAVVLIALIAFFIITQAAPKADVISDLSFGEQLIDNSSTSSSVDATTPILSITDLGVVTGYEDKDRLITGLNDKGTVIGNNTNTSNSSPLAAISYFGSYFTKLTNDTTVSSPYITDINNNGIIIGKNIAKPFIYSKGKFQYVQLPNSSDSLELTAISNTGWITGRYIAKNSGPTKTVKMKVGGSLQFVSDFYGIDVNDKGDIIGGSNLGGNYIYTETSGKQRIIAGTDVDTRVLAQAINNKGTIVGAGPNRDASRLKGGSGQKDLGQLPREDTNSSDYNMAYDVNERNQIVGTSNGKAFIYSDSNGLRDLNTLIPSNSGWQLVRAYNINELGMISGVGMKSGVLRGFLLVPNGSNL